MLNRCCGGTTTVMSSFVCSVGFVYNLYRDRNGGIHLFMLFVVHLDVNECDADPGPCVDEDVNKACINVIGGGSYCSQCPVGQQPSVGGGCEGDKPSHHVFGFVCWGGLKGQYPIITN